MKTTPWEVYIIATESGKLYTGITNDFDRRLQQHQSGKGGAKFFRTSKALRVVFREVCTDRSEASKRESAIKRLPRLKKLALINGLA